MDLMLWRHAEAVECDDPAQDSFRKLTPRGEKQANRMAHWLDRQLPQTTRVWTSPTVRTQQTASALGRPCKVRKELAPDGSVDQIIELIGWPNAKSPFLLVGHQPMLGHLIARLLGISAGELPVKKGSVWWLRYRQRGDFGQTVLFAVQSPDTL
ncbi:MAG: histidine phosphatase family protein [Rhodoferax sp.]|uniref:SixA phosphatase family protein n=1 Tax=Rhodoferax sp. TaxID=50421 RepID=UPI0026036444|nr:histidine phosphatase family protein [Rhodoferax sp.]MDD2882142.1 histidine phosphatase family protein [Rhodoferax sp.]